MSRFLVQTPLLYQAFAGRTHKPIDLKTCGMLMFCKSEHRRADESRFADRANDLGCPARILNPREIAELDASVTMDAVGGVHYPRGARFQPVCIMETASVASSWTALVLLLQPGQFSGKRHDHVRVLDGDVVGFGGICNEVVKGVDAGSPTFR